MSGGMKSLQCHGHELVPCAPRAPWRERSAGWRRWTARDRSPGGMGIGARSEMRSAIGSGRGI